MNAVSGVPCDMCGSDGRADILERASDGPIPVGMILECGVCKCHFMWMLDIPQ